MNDSWDGAIGALQRNETEIVAFPVYYPIQDRDNQYFEYSLPFHEDRMMIACAYNSSYRKIEIDITSMFTSVSYELWMAVLVAFLTFVSLLNMGYKLMGTSSRYKSPLWMVTSAFLAEDNFPDDSTFNKFVNITACIFQLFFGGYLMNSMSSDLVVYVNPPVVTSYSDIFDRVDQGYKMQIILPPFLPEGDKFRDADPGSPENRLYKLRSTLLDRKNGQLQHPVTYIMGKLADPFIKLEAIGILREDAIKALAAWSFNVAGDVEGYEPIKGLLNTDPEGKKFTNIIVFRKNANPRIYKEGRQA